MSTIHLSKSGRRLRTTHWKKRAREKFWTEHGEKFRLVLVGGGMIVLATALMAFALRR